MNASIRAIFLHRKRKGDRDWVKASSEAKRSPSPAKIKRSGRCEAKWMTIRQHFDSAQIWLRYSKEEFAKRGSEAILHRLQRFPSQPGSNEP
jgi:hypothetical protein